jgi:uncharacterized repeat protein (TIGR01451 family)
MIKFYKFPILFILLTLFIVKGVKAQVPVANFKANKTVVEIYEGIQIYDSSTNTPFQWEWMVYDSTTYASSNFYPNISSSDVTEDPLANGNNRYSKNPQFVFNVIGKYTVALRSRNSSGWSNWKIINQYITVKGPSNFNIGIGVYGINNDNIVDNESGTIADDGGANFNYGNNQGMSTRSFLTIRPCNAKTITLTMSQLRFADNFDVLEIYDAEFPDPNKLLRAWNNSNTSNPTVIANSGSMYIQFNSNSSGTDSGFYGSFTTVLDTVAVANLPYMNTDTTFYNSVPAEFENLNAPTSGVSIYKWSINGNQAFNGFSRKFRTTFYTDGYYDICLGVSTCSSSKDTCKTIHVVTPNSKTNINFKASDVLTTEFDPVYLIPETDNANRFFWSISPSSYQLLNQPNNQTTSGPGFVNFTGNFGDSLPVPKILFLDTVCYTIKLKAFNSLNDTVTADSLTKTAYVCGKSFQVVYPINGIVYNDKDNDCSKSGTEQAVKNIAISLFDSSNNFVAKTYTNQNGMYGFKSGNGSYTVKITKTYEPFAVNCPIGLDSTFAFTGSGSLNGINFPIVCENDTTDYKIHSVAPRGLVFPGKVHSLNVKAGIESTWTSLNCAGTTSGGRVKIIVLGKVAFDNIPNGYLIPDSANGNEYVYNIANFNNLSLNSFVINFKTDTSAQNNDTIKVMAEIFLTGFDRLPNNNASIIEYKVGNSYDPNIKEVYPESVQPNYNNWLLYTIHFQNTGTAPAINIRLQDTLDDNLLPETFEITDASHDVRLDLRQRNIKFFFDDIMLPDSQSQPLKSMGYIQYRIKPKNKIPKETVIANKAYIFFDYNTPIVTNTALTTFEEYNSIISPIIHHNFKVYPNPTHGLFTLEFENNTTGNLSLFSIDGQLIKQIQMDSNRISIDLNGFEKGIYIVKFEIDGEYYHCKLIKE